MIAISKPATAKELIQILKDNGYTDANEETLRQCLKVMKNDQKAKAELHRLNRTDSRNKTKSKKERAERTHKLCNVGAAVTHFYPELLELFPDELINLFEKVFNYDFTIERIIQFAIQNSKKKKEGDMNS